MKYITFLGVGTALLMLSACGKEEGATKTADSNAVTETRMDDIDAIEGTISDDMINLDEATDQAATAASDDSSSSSSSKSAGDASAEEAGDAKPSE